MSQLAESCRSWWSLKALKLESMSRSLVAGSLPGPTRVTLKHICYLRHLSTRSQQHRSYAHIVVVEGIVQDRGAHLDADLISAIEVQQAGMLYPRPLFHQSSGLDDRHCSCLGIENCVGLEVEADTALDVKLIVALL